MADAALLPDIDWHATVSDAVRTLDNLRVVIPLLVVDELDDAKRDKTRTRARQTLKLIYDRFGGDVKGRRLLRPASTSFAEVSLQLLLDPPQHSRLPRATSWSIGP